VSRPDVVRDLAALRSRIAGWRQENAQIALVPTMGALHDGHLALVDQARTLADRVVVSIFINPTQFAPNEDFASYPRTFETDLDALAGGRADLVWAPKAIDMYPDGFATTVKVAGPAEGLETHFRPHFFDGVATVCAKLFIQAAPDYAMFGEKDFQQLAVVRRMASDLNLPLEVVGIPTVREPSGLALSSRNAYLSEADAAVAPALYATLLEVAASIRAGRPMPETERAGTARLLDRGFASVDYVAVRHQATMQPIAEADLTARLKGRVLAAAWLGNTRLIDNIPVANLDET